MKEEKEESGEKRESTANPGSPPDKKPWEEPKLDFVEPKLTKHGSLEKLTRMPNGFFGGFSP
jgi:hypothetical protein